MTTRRRIVGKQPDVSGGGSQPGITATLQWGPNFGEQDEWVANVTLDMPSIALDSTRTVGVNQTGALDAVYEQHPQVGVNATLPSVQVVYEQHPQVGVNLTGALAPDYQVPVGTIGANLTMPALALEHTKTVGVRCSGVANGAPFYVGDTTAINTGTGATLTLSFADNPPGLDNFDFYFAAVAARKTAGVGNITVPTGWSGIQVTGSAAIENMLLGTFYKEFDGTGDTTPPHDFTFGGVATAYSGAIGLLVALRGCKSPDPIDVSGVGTATVADPVNVSVTTVTARARVFAVLAHLHGAVAETHTPHANHRERDDRNVAVGGTNMGIHIMERVFEATGATGTATHDCTQTVGLEARYHRVAFAPAEVVMAI